MARARTLLVPVDSRLPEPLQLQIYAGVRRAILDGVIAPGTRLPSSRQLAADLGVSRTTTVLAFDQLMAEGYLTGRSGSGTFVADDLPDDWLREPMAAARASRHPPLSRRGRAMAATPPTVKKIEGGPRAFRIGTPALDCFPIHVWNRLAARRAKSRTVAQLDYGDAAGLPVLREAIADHVRRARGTNCDAAQVIVVRGAQHGLEMICRLLLDPGDPVWMEDPGYPGARGALIAAGASVRPVPVDRDGLRVDVGARRTPAARLAYVTPSHQFPLGVRMSLPRRMALLAWARSARAWIIEDDYDSEFRYGTRPIPSLHGLDVDGRVIYLGSFSKTLFPALRLGFLIVPSDLRDAIVGARRADDIQPPSLDQAVAADFIADGHFERHLRLMRAEYRARLDALASAMVRHCRGALTLRPVATGLHAVADLVNANEESVFDEALARGVELMPLAAYYGSRRPSAGQALVLGFGSIRPELVDPGMERLAAAIEAACRTQRRQR